MEVALVIWLLFGIVTTVVAINKGLNGCIWFLFGVVLGPFGFILSLVVAKNQPAVEQAAVNSGTVKKCPYCAELIKAEAIKCRFCGSALPKAKTRQPQGQPPSFEIGQRVVTAAGPGIVESTTASGKAVVSLESGGTVAVDLCEVRSAGVTSSNEPSPPPPPASATASPPTWRLILDRRHATERDEAVREALRDLEQLPIADPVSEREIAVATGLTLAQVNEVMARLHTVGVPSRKQRDEHDGSC